MAKQSFELKHGIKLVEKMHKECVIREATTGDILDAQDAAEKLVMVPGRDGDPVPRLVVSDHRMGMELARRQIVSIGGIKGDPLSAEDFRLVHPEDLEIIQAELEKLDGAGAEEVLAQRGRSEGVGDSD